jgi:aspartate kinase
VVVISAMGKTTNRLLAAADAAAAGDLAGARAAAAELRAFHQAEAAPAVRPGSLDQVFAGHFRDLDAALAEIAGAGAVSPRLADQVAAYGELLASAILAEALKAAGIDAAWIDCRQVVVTDDAFTRAQPDYEVTDERLCAVLEPLLAAGRVPVVGGYVGATRDGVTTTLGKEGSDFSAAIVGAALGAEEVQILTDVDGILTADPRLVAGARRVPALSFAEALELDCSGSKKPHPGTLGPASRRGVPIRVLHARRPEALGTLIGPRPAGPPAIRSIVCRGNSHLLYACAGEAHAGNGFLPGVLALCERFRPALLVLGATAAGVPLALARAERLAEVRAALSRVSEVGVAPGQAVISLVSEDLAESPALVERALAAAGEWEPRLVVDGAACPAVRFLVDEDGSAAAVAAVHARLFPEGSAEA